MNVFHFVSGHRKTVAVVAVGVILGSILLVRTIAMEPNAAKVERPPEPGVAMIDAEMAKASGIRVVVAGPQNIDETVTLYGFIKPNANRQQELRARFPGVVRTVTVQPGAVVAAHATLATVEANESLQTYAIRAPISGTVLVRAVNPGSSVGGDAALLTIADLTTVWGEFAVFARDLGKVRVGSPVRILDADGVVRGETTLAYVAPAGDSESQSVVARVEMDNRSDRWVPGQFATAEVIVSRTRATVGVKPSALQSMSGTDVVFVQVHGGFAPRKVTVGHRARDFVEIIAGLNPGERYAVENSYLIKAELLKGEAEED